MPAYETLAIPGYRDEWVPHTFFRQESPSDHLALIFPGMGYTAFMPLLYYPLQMLLARGADVLRVETVYYRRPDYLALGDEDQLRWVKADTLAACRAGLAQGRYRRVTLVGKSLGTLSMRDALAAHPDLPGLACVWLTPILTNPGLRKACQHVPQRALFVIGTADSYYRPAELDEVVQATGGERLVIPNADHSLELRGDVGSSLRELQKIMGVIERFLAE